MLSSVKGAGVTFIKVNGAEHEYTSLKGVSDDVLKIVMNLKNVVFVSSSDKEEIVKLEVKGGKSVKASDIALNSKVTIVNPEYVITETYDAKTKLNIEIGIENGVGYRLADEEKT